MVVFHSVIFSDARWQDGDTCCTDWRNNLVSKVAPGTEHVQWNCSVTQEEKQDRCQMSWRALQKKAPDMSAGTLSELFSRKGKQRLALWAFDAHKWYPPDHFTNRNWHPWSALSKPQGRVRLLNTKAGHVIGLSFCRCLCQACWRKPNLFNSLSLQFRAIVRENRRQKWWKHSRREGGQTLSSHSLARCDFESEDLCQPSGDNE